MANLFDDIVYVSIQDVKDTSNLEEIQNKSNKELTRYITEAQYIIDNYIWRYETKLDENQTFIFPIEDSGWIIPTEISLATIYIVEDLVLTWEPVNIDWKIVKESTWDHSVEYNISNTNTNIPDKAKTILNKYREIFFKQVI